MVTCVRKKQKPKWHSNLSTPAAFSHQNKTKTDRDLAALDQQTTSRVDNRWKTKEGIAAAMSQPMHCCLFTTALDIYLELPMGSLQQLFCLFPGTSCGQDELIYHHLFPEGRVHGENVESTPRDCLLFSKLLLH